MVAKIINTDQTSQYAVGASDFVVLMPGVALTVEATTAPGFLADHDGICTLTVLGQVVTFGSGAVIGKTATDTMLATVTVGADGLVQSLTGYGVDIRRSGTRIDNDGVISGGNAGVTYAAGVTGGELANSGTISSLLGCGIAVAGAAGGGSPSLFALVNSGSIEAATDGVSVKFESLDLTNHGDIIGFDAGIVLTDDASLENTLTLINAGLIQGGTAAIDATGHGDSVTNSGALMGAVLLGEGDNLLDNTGTLSGPVSAGSGADRLTNTGVVTGAVDLGGGDNRVTNDGRLAAGLTFGAGEDRLLSTGTIRGDIALGDGSNTARLEGAVYGSLAGGDNADDVEIRDRFTGDVTLGNGADRLVLYGRIDGDVDLGSGTDRIYLWAEARTVDSQLDGGSGADELFTRIDVEDAFNFETVYLRGNAQIGVVADAIDNTVYGNRGANRIDGGDGDDQLFGRAGGDVLLGRRGADLLSGNSGADDLIGGGGGDNLKGGRGKDTFIFEAISDSLRRDPDHILDFEPGRDKIDLSELVAGTIDWRGDGKYTRSGDAELRYKVGDDAVELKIDVNGDGKIDMEVFVDDLTGLDAGDVFL